MNHFSLILAALSATIASTRPTTRMPTDFLLITTTSPAAACNSSELPDVNATSLFQPNSLGIELYQLRLIAPGYLHLPTFNISHATLRTDAYGPHGVQMYEYDSTRVARGHTLDFDATPEGSGNLALEGGYLLAVDGETKGWTVCPGEHDQAVIYWKGDDAACEPRYIQAVKTAPY